MDVIGILFIIALGACCIAAFVEWVIDGIDKLRGGKGE